MHCVGCGLGSLVKKLFSGPAAHRAAPGMGMVLPYLPSWQPALVLGRMLVLPQLPSPWPVDSAGLMPSESLPAMDAGWPSAAQTVLLAQSPFAYFVCFAWFPAQGTELPMEPAAGWPAA